MRILARQGRLYFDGVPQSPGTRAVLVDAGTGQRIPLARRADTDTGEYEAFRTLDGTTPLRDDEGRPVTYRGRCRLRLWVGTPGVVASPSATAVGADPPPRPAPRVRSLLDDAAAPECDEPLCHRRAAWAVGDVAELPPLAAPDGTPYRRTSLASARYYCDAHWRPPTATSPRGVTREITEVVRP